MAEQEVKTNPVVNNYTLIEVLHLSYLIRDTLEYCHSQIQVNDEAFQRRATMAKSMLAEGNFIHRWLTNHPSEQIQKYYTDLVEFFKNIYEVENYVEFKTKKVDDEKSVDVIQRTVELYQVSEDIVRAFYNEYKKTPNLVEKDIERDIIASVDYNRVITCWLLFNEIIKNDNNYKKALHDSGNKPSYEVNYNLNLLKRLIGIFSFVRQRYSGDKVDIIQMYDDCFQAFRTLDGTLFAEIEKKENKTLTNEEKTELAKGTIEKAAQECVAAIRTYEAIWKETYAKVVEYMKNNPLPAQQAQQ